MPLHKGGEYIVQGNRGDFIKVLIDGPLPVPSHKGREYIVLGIEDFVIG